MKLPEVQLAAGQPGECAAAQDQVPQILGESSDGIRGCRDAIPIAASPCPNGPGTGDPGPKAASPGWQGSPLRPRFLHPSPTLGPYPVAIAVAAVLALDVSVLHSCPYPCRCPPPRGNPGNLSIDRLRGPLSFKITLIAANCGPAVFASSRVQIQQRHPCI